MKKPEILAPAGSMEGLQAAIYAGADAVYMGGSRFGARAYADNPDREKMMEAISYCHFYGKKLYMTVNTLMKEEELEGELMDFLAPYYEAGLDAVIVQDVGAVEFIHQNFPDLDIHASTQMTLTGAYGLPLLKGMGVSRLVPARELNIQELRELRSQTNLEIEVFVHGALCYCYSGQCLMSSMTGERSGNRGRCAQPCRLPYRPDIQGGNYILSLKEFCGLEWLGELADIGIDSFKIEGRMKKPVYAALATAVYAYYVGLFCKLGKKEYDNYIHTHTGQMQEHISKLQEIYNRGGFTQGYFPGYGREGREKQRDMLSAKRPRHGGVYLGKVIQLPDRNIAKVQLEKDIAPQDVVEFRTMEGKSLYEYTVKDEAKAGARITARFLPGSGIKVGDLLYRTRKSDMIAAIEAKYGIQKQAKNAGGGGSVPCRRAIEGKLMVKAGKPALLALCTKGPEELVWEITVEGEPVQKAKNQALTEEQLRRQFEKTGESGFCWSRLDIELGQNCFMAVGQQNALRRKAFAALTEKILSHSKRQKRTAQIPWTPAKIQITEKKPLVVAAVHNKEQLEVVLDSPYVDEIYLHLEDCSIAKCQAILKGISKQLFLFLPHICRSLSYKQLEAWLQREDSIWYDGTLKGCVVCNMEELALLGRYRDRLGESFVLIGNHNLYCWNKRAREFWLNHGITYCTAPLELQQQELRELDISDMELVLYAHLPLMVSAQCLLRNAKGCQKGQKTEKEFIFSGKRKAVGATVHKEHAQDYMAIAYCDWCYNVIYDASPYNLIGERIDELQPCRVRLEFVREDAVETEKILKQLAQAKTEQKERQGTKGHFYKKVL